MFIPVLPFPIHKGFYKLFQALKKKTFFVFSSTGLIFSTFPTIFIVIFMRSVKSGAKIETLVFPNPDNLHPDPSTLTDRIYNFRYVIVIDRAEIHRIPNHISL